MSNKTTENLCFVCEKQFSNSENNVLLIHSETRMMISAHTECFFSISGKEFEKYFGIYCLNCNCLLIPSVVCFQSKELKLCARCFYEQEDPKPKLVDLGIY